MADTEHKYEVSLDGDAGRGERKNKEDGNVRNEDGKVTVSLAPHNDHDALSVSQDAVSPTYADEIEQAVLNSSTNDKQEQEQQHQEQQQQEGEERRDSRLLTLEKENETLRTEIKNATDILAKEREEKAKALNTLKEAEEQITTVRKEAHLHAERVSKAETQVRALQELENEREKERERESLRIAELGKRAEEAEAQARKVAEQSQSNDKKESVERAEEHIRVLQAQLGSVSHELETEKKTKQEAEEKHNQQVESLVNEITQHGNKLRAQETRLRLENESKVELVSLLETMKAQFRIKEAELTLAQQDKAQTQAKFNQVQMIMGELKKQNAELLRQYEDERAKHSATSLKLSTEIINNNNKNKPPAPAQDLNNWGPYSGWVPSIVFVGLSALAAAKLLHK